MIGRAGFSHYSPHHIITIFLILIIAAFFVLIARRGNDRMIKYCGWGLAFVMVANELSYITGAIILGHWSYTWGIPLQLCDLAIFAVAYSLIRHKQWVWELAYFWGLGGTLQAILTPELHVQFPDYIFIKFFLTHGCIVVGVLFLSAGCRRPIKFMSAVRVLIITNVYAAFVACINWMFNTNYLYLCAKPSQPSIIDLFGSWPYYIFGLELVLIISLLAYYLPYYIAEKRGTIKFIN